MEERWLGVLAGIGSIVFFGSYAVPIRLPVAAGVDPVVFQAYKTLVCFSTAWLVLFFEKFRFTWWGLVGGGAWVFTGTVAILAVKLAGIGSTQSIWSGLSIFVSFFWGAYVFDEHISSGWLSYFSLLLMAIGMAGVAISSARKYDWSSMLREEDLKLFSPEDPVLEVLVPAASKKRLPASEAQIFIYGVAAAVLVGFVNGSLMVPLKYANQTVVGIEYLISFGIGSMAATMVLLVAYHLFRHARGEPGLSFHLGAGALAAVAAGAFWSAGNFCSLYATLYLGLSLGWPLVQCQILVSALWSVLYFKEVTEPKQVIGLLLSTGLVIAGAIILFEFGPVGK